MKTVIITFWINGLLVLGATAQSTCPINGNTQACTGQEQTFTTTCPYGNSNGWIVNNQIVGSGTTLNFTFNTVGTYTVTYYYEDTQCQLVWDPDAGAYVEQCNPIYGEGSMEVTVGLSPIVPVVVSDANVLCTPATVNLNVSNVESGTSYSWHSVPTGYTGTGPTLAASSVNQTTQFVVTATKGSCSWTPSKTVTFETTLASPVLDPAMLYHKRTIYPSVVQSNHYWQTTTDGTQDIYPATTARTITEPGTFYIRKLVPSVECWTEATGPVEVTLNYTPYLAVVALVQRSGYTDVVFTHADKAHLLQHANFYWVDGDNSTSILQQYNDGAEIIGSKTFESGTYYLRGRNRNNPETWGPTLSIEIEIRTDAGVNYTQATTLDGTAQNAPVSISRNYFDEAGKLVQSQSKVLSQDAVLVSQPVLDRLCRTVGSTLAAPIAGSNFIYSEAFFLNPVGNPYGPLDFDYVNPVDPEDNTKYNPLAAGNNYQGTLGWYYSASNTIEPDVAKFGKSQYPYSRKEFYEDGTGEIKRSASPGDFHRLGMEHEVLSGSFPVFDELDYYMEWRDDAMPGIGGQPSPWNGGVQSVVRDENGKYSISITDKQGNTVMTARKGSQPTNQHVLAVANSITVVGPKLVYFYLLNDEIVTISGSADFIAEDIVSEVKKPVGGTFTNQDGKWPTGFYRISVLSGSFTISYANYYQDVAYQYYDDAGRLLVSVSPNGVKALKSGTVAFADIDKTTYDYNHRGWLLEMSETDAGTTSYQYRSDGKIRFSRNAEQTQRFSYTRYDRLGRPTESGEYKGTGHAFSGLTNQLEFTQQVDYPEADVADRVRTFYDLQDPNFHSETGLPAGANGFNQRFVRGAVSYTDNDNNKTWYSYDELGRVEWMAQKPKALPSTFLISYTYDFIGHVLMTRFLQYDAGWLKHSFYHHYDYDADKRLVAAHTSLDGVQKKLRATYHYYLHGPLKRIELGGKTQGIDFVYNINGWLRGINNPHNNQDPGEDGYAGSPRANYRKDAFAMMLDYYESEMEDLFPIAMRRQDIKHSEQVATQKSIGKDSAEGGYVSEGSQVVITDGETAVKRALARYLAKEHDLKRSILEVGQITPPTLNWQQSGNGTSIDYNQTADENQEFHDFPGVSTQTLEQSSEKIFEAPGQVVDGSAGASYEPIYSPPPPDPVDVVWTYATGVTVNGNSITRTAAGNNWGTSGASSVNILPPNIDGWAEMTVPSEVGTGKMFGLAAYDPDLHYTMMNYAFYVNGSITIYESGTSKGVISGGNAVAGEVFRIERVGSVVYYKRNGTTVYTSQTASTSHLIVDAAIASSGSRIHNAKASFGLDEVAFGPVWIGVTGATETNGALTKTATTGDNNAGAWSSNQLGAGKNGWIQYTVNQTGKLSFGFSDTNTDNHWNTIDYGIRIESSGATVINNGATPQTTSIATGDVFRIERSGSSIYAKKNGTIIHTFNSALTSAIYVDVSLIDNGAILSGLQTSYWISPAEGLIPDIRELRTLKDVYDSLGGANWTTKTNWPTAGSWPATATAATMDTWHGIYVTGGDIKYVQLGTNNLIGKLPASISSLGSLSRLEVNGNKVNGSLTSSVGSLVGLTVLYFQNNDIVGTVPSSLTNLKLLTALDLRNNLFTGTFPQFLPQLTRLQTLNVGENRTTGFTGTIPDLSSLTSVTSLIIRNNPNLDQAGLPSWIGSLPQLTTVLMANNHFSGILPESWRALTNLTDLDLSYNEVYELPEWLGDLNNLVTLTIQHAGVAGPIPASIGQLTDLQQLYLANNALSGSIPTQINDAIKLKLIYLYLNQLTGTIPPLNALVDLETVNMRDNYLTGAIGSWVSGLTKLKVLHIDNNQLTSVAPEILQLPLMTTLNFSGNKLTSIPNFFTYSNKANLNLYVYTNYLDFEDLEPLFGSGTHGIKTFTYSPQRKFTFLTKKHVPSGALLELVAQPKAQLSSVNWEKQNGAAWNNVNASDEDATLQTYKISNVGSAQNGNYRWKMTNTRVTGLTIECDPIEVMAVDALPTQPGSGALFNGMIASTSWKGEVPYGMDQGTNPQNGMYLYKYDDRYQIIEANWAEPNFTTHTFSLSANKFRVTNLAYDPNGNIQSLNRYDESGNRIHNFAYTYEANKNSLRTVSGHVVTNGYTYTNLGQLKREDKVSGQDQYIEYDVTGKVRKVFNNPAKQLSQLIVEYLYDDRGFRIAKYAKAPDKTTWYIRDGSGTVLAIYEQDGAPAQLNENPAVMTEVPIYGSGKLGTYYPQQDGSAVYEVTDHLGNVRALVRDNVSTYTATMEHTGSQDLTDPRVEEMQYFENLFETEVDDYRMNHTSPVATPEPSPDKSAYLYWVEGMSGMGAADKSIGPAIALNVSAGDTINMEAWVRYENKVSYNRNITLASLASYLGTSYAYRAGFEAFNAAQTATSFNSALATAGFMGDGSITDRPFAYLNYIVFNSSKVMVTAGWQRVDFGGFDPGQEVIYGPNGELLDPEVGFGHMTFESPIPITQDGSIYVWVSNESEATKVWFDDLTVVHSQKISVQSADFGVWGDLLRQQTTAEGVYRYGYQGQFAEKDGETGWSHFELREFDPLIGRWTVVDPYIQFSSPYVGMGNSPINGVDTDGGLFGKWRAKAWAKEHNGTAYYDEVSKTWWAEAGYTPGAGPGAGVQAKDFGSQGLGFLNDGKSLHVKTEITLGLQAGFETDNLLALEVNVVNFPIIAVDHTAQNSVFTLGSYQYDDKAGEFSHPGLQLKNGVTAAIPLYGRTYEQSQFVTLSGGRAISNDYKQNLVVHKGFIQRIDTNLKTGQSEKTWEFKLAGAFIVGYEFSISYK